MGEQAKRQVNQLALIVSKMKKGFTLIELLVVIVIIGVLMGILLVSYQGPRVTARDGKRKADLEQIRSALELYHADCGQYPTAISSTGGSLTSVVPPCSTDSVTYMSKVPQDPLPTLYTYRYSRESLHVYYLCAHLEGSSPGAPSGCPSSCTASGEPASCNYGVIQP
jgi:general secretion pathway protein G